ncbi:unnamed protein product [Tuwongella immobilis]|uniref:Uncharacterized protein n=1 Tax=Tuwongella immobilis TaxID=692036 RepID=A0A6C2YK63_9BACT|nr:unnamed protein product [Tuwongella immobilis]VTR99537.1 unnamed protein product [Tuwongella immobilis]
MTPFFGKVNRCLFVVKWKDRRISFPQNLRCFGIAKNKLLGFFCQTHIRIMRPDGPAPGVIADEVGVPLRDSAVVDDLIIGGFFGCVDGEPFATCCEQSITGDEFARFGPADTSLAAVAPEGVLAGGADGLAGDGKVQHAGVAREDLLDDAGFDRSVRIVFIARVNQVAGLQRFAKVVAGRRVQNIEPPAEQKPSASR